MAGVAEVAVSDGSGGDCIDAGHLCSVIGKGFMSCTTDFCPGYRCAHVSSQQSAGCLRFMAPFFDRLLVIVGARMRPNLRVLSAPPRTDRCGMPTRRVSSACGCRECRVLRPRQWQLHQRRACVMRRSLRIDVPAPGNICVIRILQFAPVFGSIHDRLIPRST